MIQARSAALWKTRPYRGHTGTYGFDYREGAYVGRIDGVLIDFSGRSAWEAVYDFQEAVDGYLAGAPAPPPATPTTED
jgi:hypothetical protein